MHRAALRAALMGALGVAGCSRPATLDAGPADDARGSGADPGAELATERRRLCRPGLACVPGSSCQANNPRGLDGPEYEECVCGDDGRFICPPPAASAGAPKMICLPGACSPGQGPLALSRRYKSDCFFPVPDGSPPATKKNGEGRDECCQAVKIRSCD